MNNLQKAMLCIIITGLFLMPLMGNPMARESRHWMDTYVFCSYDEFEHWVTDPRNMIDGENDTYASTGYDENVQWCNGNNCTGGYPSSDIIKVEINARGYTSCEGANIILRAVFSNGAYDGENHTFILTENEEYSEWFDITDELETHLDWTWYDVVNLDCDVEADIPNNPPHLYNVYCSIVQIRVTYSP